MRPRRGSKGRRPGGAWSPFAAGGTITKCGSCSVLRELVDAVASRRDAAGGKPRVVRGGHVAGGVADPQPFGRAQLARAAPGGAHDFGAGLRVAAVAAEAEGTPQTGAGQLQLRTPGEIAGAEAEQNAAARPQPLEQDGDAGQGDIGLARALHGERFEVTGEDSVDVARRHAMKPLVERHCLAPLGGEDRARDRAIGHAVEPHLAQLGGCPRPRVQRLAESAAAGAAAMGEGPVEIEEQRSHAPETTSSAKRMVGEAVEARKSRSSPTASIPRSMSGRLPLKVTSCTGYASSPI